MTKLFLPMLALTLSGCASGSDADNSRVSLDVKTVEANRSSLNGQVIVVEGFLSKVGKLLFLMQGRPRPADEVGEEGETFWCIYPGGPTNIWVKEDRFRRIFARVAMDQMNWHPNTQGRRVIIRGVLRDRNIPKETVEVDLATLNEEVLAKLAVGPLENATIISVLPELCAASDAL